MVQQQPQYSTTAKDGHTGMCEIQVLKGTPKE